MSHKERLQYTIQGQVQGVGFRPFVFRLATKHSLSGFVSNSSLGVLLEIQGKKDDIDAFQKDFSDTLPPLTKISSQEIKQIPLHTTEYAFFIKHTNEGEHQGNSVFIGADCALCSECHADILTSNLSSKTARYAYPFTNCTNCGPRYTITKSIPYDREYTSMACFSMCESCQMEYDNPFDRRFHAQPNACEKCGPKIWLQKNDFLGENNKENTLETVKEKMALDTIFEVQKLLKKGNILAIKALGGFQLACDAYNEEAIEILRMRKHRPHKAFAIMVQSLEDAQKIAHISEEAAKLLTSSAAPIVLCEKKNLHIKQESFKQNYLPENIAPDTHKIGIMLAYTPLHKLLFQKNLLENLPLLEEYSSPSALIMTSANISGEPICIGNRQALKTLETIADYYLFHNRDILVRVDDSVCLALQNVQRTHLPPVPFLSSLDSIAPKALFFRRARGYVPDPIALPVLKEDRFQEVPQVFASGALLKNTFCMTRQNNAFVSQHIGDLENLAVMEFYEETFKHLQKLLEIKTFDAVVCDLHPDFPSTQFAQNLAREYSIPLYTLPHHFAHIYAVLAEYKDFSEKSATLALVLDGTGLGIDGTSWGGELLYLDPNPENTIMLRLGRLSPMTLVGGDIAIKEPWRIAHAMLLQCTEKKYFTEEESEALYNYQKENYKAHSPEIIPLISIIESMLEKNINCFESSGCGRLFDAISALLTSCFFTTYEGQAAIKLESCQNIAYKVEKKSKIYDCPIHENALFLAQKKLRITRKTCIDSFFEEEKQVDSFPIWELDSHALFAQCAKELLANEEIAGISKNFHKSLANSLTQMAIKARDFSDVKNIVLCGGVMNNEILFSLLSEELSKLGFNVLTPQNMPAGDGAISLGQAYYGLLKSIASC